MIPPAERIADSDIITRCRQTAGAELSKQMTVKMKDFFEEIAMNIKIIVATHKKYWMPDDEIYLPLHVGAEGKKDAEGNEHESAIRIVNEEGNWNDWSRNISAQMLSKQPPALAKRQLDLTYASKREQLNDILSLTNPTVKQKMLEDFADGCDSDAVHLKAYGFPCTCWSC